MSRLATVNELRAVLPARIAYWRKKRSLTQNELGERVGLHQVSVARLETGIHLPARHNLERIARALGVALEVFLEAPHEGDRLLTQDRVPA
jgi:transcriptional regulator with XRE-family HTH domain